MPEENRVLFAKLSFRQFQILETRQRIAFLVVGHW